MVWGEMLNQRVLNECLKAITQIYHTYIIMLRQRVLTAAVVLPSLLILVIFSSHLVWAALTIIVISICAKEWCSISGLTEFKKNYFIVSLVLANVVVLLCLNMPQFYHSSRETLENIVFFITLISVVLIILAIYFRWYIKSKIILASTGWILLFNLWLSILELQRDPFFFLAVLGIVFVSDTAAYFTGKKFGKSSLAPQISPNKTWEGVLGAYVGTTIFVSIFVYLLQPEIRDALLLYLYTGLIVALCVFGDLFVSLLKRLGDLKDSGNLLPGHGGLLDRVDSMILALPFAFLIVSGIGA